jgi:hypothetical protein
MAKIHVTFDASDIAWCYCTCICMHPLFSPLFLPVMISGAFLLDPSSQFLVAHMILMMDTHKLGAGPGICMYLS